MDKAIIVRLFKFTTHLGWLIGETYKHFGMVVLLRNFDCAVSSELLVFTVPLTAFEREFLILFTDSFLMFDMLQESQNHWANFQELLEAVSPIKIVFVSPNVKLPPVGSSTVPNH